MTLQTARSLIRISHQIGTKAVKFLSFLSFPTLIILSKSKQQSPKSNIAKSTTSCFQEITYVFTAVWYVTIIQPLRNEMT